MDVAKKLISLLFILPTLAFAQNSPSSTEDCLSIQDDYVSLIESGKYRYANEKQPDGQATVEKIDFSTLTSFQDYLHSVTALIEQRNPKASMPCPVVTKTYKQLAQQNNWQAVPQTSQLVAPFELTQDNNRKAILLIHGLTDSPYSFHDLSQFFYQQGYTVRTLLMPGHGTAPSDLLNVEYSEWQQAAKFAIEQTVKDFDSVYLGGLSTGGALIFDYLMQQDKVDNKIRGLFMWSPASKAKNDSSWLAQYVDWIPFVDWIDLDSDTDFAKYESFPYNAGAQVHGIMSLVVGNDVPANRKLHELPVFVVASEYDQTINTEYTIKLVSEWQSASPSEKMKKSALIYYGDGGKLPKNIENVMTLVVPECLPASLCNDVFDVSHIATTHSPQNPHYGLTGKYRNCGHYIADVALYRACKENKEVSQGETTAQNLSQHQPIQRLTYNPYYTEMLAEMERFILVTF